MGKIQYKKITSDGTEGKKYSSLNTRKVTKKVGDKGDYSDVVLNSPFIKLEKTGTGTTTNPYIYQFDVEDSFVNSLSAQKNLIKNDYIENKHSIESIKEELMRLDNRNLQASYKSLSFSINILDFLNKQQREQKPTNVLNEIEYIHNPEQEDLKVVSENVLDKNRLDTVWFKNNKFIIDNLNGDKIHYLKGTFINDDSNLQTLKYKEETRVSDYKRISLDNVSNISKILKLKFSYDKNSMSFHFEKNGMPVTYIHLLNLIKQNSIKGNVLIKVYAEYN